MRGEPGGFEIVCEIEPATDPDLRLVRQQIGVLTSISSCFLIPDNHIGRATVSSIAVAHEVLNMGGRAIACLNARDRNTLGFRRDLLTAWAYGVSELLFVYGDRPESGRRSDDLNVKTMIAEARRFAEQHGDRSDFRIGVATGLRPLPEWKREADFLFVQVGFSLEALLDWRSTIEFDGPVYAGVIVLSSAQMARKLTEGIGELAVPDEIVERLTAGPDAGIDLACELVSQIRDSGAVDGVHLIPVRRYREVARRLETLL